MPLATLFFIIVPIIEILVLIEVGGIIGGFPTACLVVLTAVCGVWLLKHEGIATLTRVQEKLAAGQIPETELLEGVMLIIGGALLLTPGFVTDFIGFVCLLPGLRRPLATSIVRSAGFASFQAHSRFSAGQFNVPPEFRERGPTHGSVIDGEFEAEQPAEQAPEKIDRDRPNERG